MPIVTLEDMLSNADYIGADIELDRYYTVAEIKKYDLLCGMNIKMFYTKAKYIKYMPKIIIQMLPIQRKMKKGTTTQRMKRVLIKGEELLKVLQAHPTGDMLYKLQERKRVKDLMIVKTQSIPF